MSSPWAAPGSSPESTPGTSGEGSRSVPGAPTGDASASPWSTTADSWGEHAGSTAPGTRPAEPGPAAGPRPGPDGAAAARSRELSVRSPLFPLRPLSLGEVLGAGTRIYRERPRTVLGITAIVLGVTFVLSSVLTGASVVPFALSLDAIAVSDTSTSTDVTLDSTAILTLVAGSLASGLLSLLGSQLVSLAVTRVAVGEAIGTPVSSSDVWALLRRRGLAALAVGLLIAVGMALALVLPAVLAGLAVALAGRSPEVSIVAFLLAALVVAVLMLWFWARTLLATPVLVTEEIGPLRAIGRSFQLTRGRRLWRVLGIGLLVGVIAYIATQVLAGALQMVATIIYTAVLLATGGKGMVVAMIILVVVTMLGVYLCTVLTLPFQSSALAALYADTRMRHEGWDVELARSARAARSGRAADEPA